MHVWVKNFLRSLTNSSECFRIFSIVGIQIFQNIIEQCHSYCSTGSKDVGLLLHFVGTFQQKQNDRAVVKVVYLQDHL